MRLSPRIWQWAFRSEKRPAHVKVLHEQVWKAKWNEAPSLSSVPSRCTWSAAVNSTNCDVTRTRRESGPSARTALSVSFATLSEFCDKIGTAAIGSIHPLDWTKLVFCLDGLFNNSIQFISPVFSGWVTEKLDEAKQTFTRQQYQRNQRAMHSRDVTEQKNVHTIIQNLQKRGQISLNRFSIHWPHIWCRNDLFRRVNYRK